MQRWKNRIEALINIATLGVLTITAILLLQVLKGRQAPQVRSPRTDDLVVGSALDTLQARDSSGSRVLIPMSGQFTLLYLFSTTCPICEAQKRHVASLVHGLSTARVLTASAESPELTRGYWRAVDEDSTLAAPLSIDRQSLLRIGGSSVPRFYLVDMHGTIVRAVVGSVSSWTTDSLVGFIEQQRP